MRLFAPLLCAVSLTAAVRAQPAEPFAAYEHCHFTDGVALVETAPLADSVEGRTVKTVMGNRNVPLSGGTRLLYAYPQTEPFANVKIEQVPEDDYPQAKQDLIANFDQILNADDTSARNYALKQRLNGLEIYGLDKKLLEGSTLGIYLYFVDPTHTVTTIYFLNQDARLRKFSSLEEYAKLRDRFVQAMTACTAGHPAPPAAKTSVPQRFAHTESTPSPSAPTTKAAAAAAAPAPQTAPVTPEVPAPADTAVPQSNDSYVPPEAAPLVHPRNAADRKAAAKPGAKTSSPAKKAASPAQKKKPAIQ